MDYVKIIEELKSKHLTKKLISSSSKEYQVNVIGLGHFSKPDNILWMFRPTLIEESEDKELNEEMDSNNPGLFLKIKRPKSVKVRYIQANGEPITHKFDGITARYFMQEWDRLNDIEPRSRVNRYHWEKAVKCKKKQERLQKQKTS